MTTQAQMTRNIFKNCRLIDEIVKKIIISEKCIHPNCECLDYCEAQDPFSETPKKPMSKEIEEKLNWYESDEWRIGRMS